MKKLTTKRAGFTLLELVITIMIVGLLCAIIIPNVFSYITKAQKKATLANGKTLWNEINSMITFDDECYYSFYTDRKNTSKWYFEAGEDGRCVAWNANPKNNVKKEGNYYLSVICRVDGRNHAIGSGVNDNPPSVVLNTWDDADYNNKNRTYYIEMLCQSHNLDPFKQDGIWFPHKMPYSGRDDGKKQPIVRWLICTRLDDPERIEIWAGDGTKAKNGPVYRVFPNACDFYNT